MDIKIDENSINEYLSNAVLNSLLGKGLKEKIDSHCNEWLKSYDSPLKKVFMEVVQEELKKQLATEENQKIIQDSVKKILESKILEKISDKVLSDLMREIKSYYS